PGGARDRRRRRPRLRARHATPRGGDGHSARRRAPAGGGRHRAQLRGGRRRDHRARRAPRRDEPQLRGPQLPGIAGPAGPAAPALLRAKGRGRRLPIAFSTLGCPGWTWPTVLDQADRLGYAGIELRGIQGDMDLTKRPELTGDGLKQTRRDLEARGIVVTDLG